MSDDKVSSLPCPFVPSKSINEAPGRHRRFINGNDGVGASSPKRRGKRFFALVKRRVAPYFHACLLILFGVSLARADFSWNGEIRLRSEYKDNNDFNKDTKDVHSFTGSRLRMTGSGLAAENIAVKFTFQDTRNWGEEIGNTGGGLTDTGEAVDIHEVFVDFQNFMNSPVSLRAGRQELSYGDQRLLGAFNWSHQGRAFDAFKLYYAGPLISVDAWTAKRKENNGAAAGSAVMDRQFSGVYATMKPLYPGGLVDVYFLHDREGDTLAAAKPKTLFTVGARLNGKNGPVDYTVEAPFQFGNNGTVVGPSSAPVKVSADALAVKAGWTFPGDREIRLGAEWDHASGDNNASDGKAKTFQNLYPTNHLFYGYMDVQGWRNMNAFNVVVSLKPVRSWFASLHYWDFSLADAKDGWYNAAGAAAGAARAASSINTNKHLGREVDILVRFSQGRSVVWEAGYGHFFAGHFVDARVPRSGDSDWAYLMSTVKF